ncbi:MAG: energy transducer TonB [Acidobacteriota bacterium]
MFGSHDDKQAKRALGATLATVGLHGLILLILVLAFTYRGEIQQAVVENTPLKFVYIQQAGPGGGGGGSPAPAPPKPISIPRTKPPAPVPFVPPPPTVTPPPPTPTLSAPVMTANRDLVQATGASSVSLAAYGGGGRGTGLGSGTGSGVGPGTGGGFGGGAYRPGAGIQNPVVLKEQKPVYTSDAMRAKIQGVVQLEAVVDENGLVNDVRVLRSLDKQYGLDQEAIKAARMWLFRPARDRDNKPVAIVITLELTFALH